jgi:hypothetical protein
MKKLHIILTIFVSLLVFYLQVVDGIISEKPTTKNLNLEVYKSNDYSSAIYNDASAKICITITKVSRKSRITIWTKTFDAIQLKQYPSIENPLLQKVAIANVVDSKEHLEILSTIMYYNNGSVLEIKDGALLSKGAKGGTLIILI